MSKLTLKRRLSLFEKMFPRYALMRAIMRNKSVMYRMDVSPSGVSPQTDEAVIIDCRFDSIGIRVERKHVDR